MKLYELIAKLKRLPPGLKLPKGFSTPHSYRGFYYELAFTPADNVSIESMLENAESAVNQTYTGWKGGEFKMTVETRVHLAADGELGETEDSMYQLFETLKRFEKVIEIRKLNKKIEELQLDLKECEESKELWKQKFLGSENRMKYLQDGIQKAKNELAVL